MNALNGVWSDIYILQNIIQQQLEKLKKYFGRKLDFKDMKFPLKIIDIHVTEKKKKRFISVLVFMVMKKRKNFHSIYQKRLLKDIFFYY